MLGDPLKSPIEKHIRSSAEDSADITFTHHARQRMRQRYVTDPMVMEVLRLGKLALPPEPDLKYPGLLCRMQRFVAGMQVAVVVYVEYPAPSLTIVTVIDMKKE